MPIPKEPVETFSRYKPLPAEINQIAILKAPATKLDEWFRTFGAEALSRRLEGV